MENLIKSKNLGRLIVFVSLIVMLGCKSYYKVEQISILYSPEEINTFISSENSSLNDLSKVPIEINKALVKNGTQLTIDTLSFNSKKHNALLKKYSKSSSSNTGYFIIISNERGKNIPECILYRIDRRTIKFTYYTLPSPLSDWESIKPFLVPDNGILRIGVD